MLHQISPVPNERIHVEFSLILSLQAVEYALSIEWPPGPPTSANLQVGKAERVRSVPLIFLPLQHFIVK